MKVLIVGGGGREHAIAWKIKKDNPEVELFCAPGNAGMQGIAKRVPIKANDMQGLLAFAKREPIDFTIVGPEEPLVAGIVNLFQKDGLKAFGPSKKGALLEGSKAFSKGLMDKYKIPTAYCAVFSDYENASAYIEDHGAPLVVKADGLAAGKGVIVCQTLEQADNALRRLMLDMQFAEAGEKVVIEDLLVGPEVSVLALIDGNTILPLESARDHKRAQDGDRGENTGGMGALSPAPGYTEEDAEAVRSQIIIPTLNAIKKEGIVYKGVLYFGLILTKEGPKVIEFNCRFGDPETQAILPRLKSNLLDAMIATVDMRLDQVNLEWEDSACACVVLASGGYPGSYIKGHPISGVSCVPKGVRVFHAGTAVDNAGDLVTDGGRVLDVAAMGETHDAAAEACYRAVSGIDFVDIQYRTDIGRRIEQEG
ncbi:MAG: phosphoribosylamine--glycine ligase [Clostridiales bacterium]|jgi:phosphoribosylamine--glycine ligase|nr:phosphoribosylamine--glycine ligase [Clostridiales bacterium]